MDIPQRAIRAKKRSLEWYISIFKDYIASCEKTGEKINRVNFGKWSKEHLGSNIEPALRRRFGVNGRENGFNVILKLCGVLVNKDEYTDEELFIFLDNVYTFTGRRYSPGQSQLYKYRQSLSEVVKSQTPSKSSVIRRFGNMSKAWDLYFEKYNIVAKVSPTASKRLGRKQGKKYDYLRNYNLRLGPVNEQGVVYLFAYLGKHLGFKDIYIQEHFPDCIAIFENKKDKDEREVQIEFKYSLSRFFDSLLIDFKKGDEKKWKGIHFVICWENELEKTNILERYALLEKRFPERSKIIKQDIIEIQFIYLKNYLNALHQ